jgi:hypothetical protein
MPCFSVPSNGSKVEHDEHAPVIRVDTALEGEESKLVLGGQSNGLVIMFDFRAARWD